MLIALQCKHVSICYTSHLVKLISFAFCAENVSHVELKVSREGGSYGDVAVHYLTTVARSQPMVHRASENMDFTATVASIILRENTTEAIVQIEILPVSINVVIYFMQEEIVRFHGWRPPYSMLDHACCNSAFA